MSISGDTPRENLTLTEADLAACRPIVGEGGHVLRALCPFHGSDRQRSLRVQVHSGRFVCFACGAWGYMETARAQWREEQQRQAALQKPPAPGSASHTAASLRRGFPGSSNKGLLTCGILLDMQTPLCIRPLTVTSGQSLETGLRSSTVRSCQILLASAVSPRWWKTHAARRAPL